MQTLSLRSAAKWAPLVAAGLCTWLSPSAARADVALGLGLVGAMGGNFTDKPDRKLTDPNLYPGFGGLTAGAGFMVDVRFLDDLLGVEVDAIRSSDKGSGTVTFNGVDYKLTVGQSAWHLPVLAKVAIPSPVVSPFFVLGPEFVFPSSSDFTIDPSIPGGKAKAESYTMITGGGGLEIKLPIPVLDLRIPLGLRLSYNPGVPSAYSERVKTRITAAGASSTYDSEWKYAVNLTAGAAIYF